MAYILDDNRISIKPKNIVGEIKSPNIAILVSTHAVGFGQIDYHFHKEDITLPSSSALLLEEYIEKKELDLFFSDKKTRVTKALGINNTLGILFHGKPGTAKTTSALAIAEYMVKNNNCTLFIVNTFQQIEASLKVINYFKEVYGYCYPIFFLDECENAFQDSVESFKIFLDGISTIDNSIFLACTNYFEDIPMELLDRPSRFKYSIEINGITNLKFIKAIFSSMNNALADEDKLTEEVINNLVKEGYEKTMDEIKHLFLNKVFQI